MTQILFLDMDGVLCTPRSCVKQPRGQIMSLLDREGCAMLDVLQREFPDLRVVLSSTWRQHFDRPEMEERLGTAGFNVRFHDDWKTGVWEGSVARGGGRRGKEIEDWLQAHPDVTEYAILDDISQFMPDQMPRLVLTQFDDGISFEGYQKLRNIFDPTAPRLVFL